MIPSPKNLCVEGEYIISEEVKTFMAIPVGIINGHIADLMFDCNGFLKCNALMFAQGSN